MDDEVGHHHIGQAFGEALPFASRGGIQAVDPDIGADVVQAGAGHIRGDAIDGGFGKPVGQVGPRVPAVSAFEDLDVVVVVGQGDPEVIGIGDIDLDVLDPGKSVRRVEQVEGLPVGGAVQAEFLGHIEPGHIAGTQPQCGGLTVGDVPEGGPILPAVGGAVDAVLGDVDPVRVEAAHGPGGEPGALRIDTTPCIAGNLDEGIATILRPEHLSIIERGVDDIFDFAVEGAGKSIAAEDVFPLAVVLEEGAVVLGACDEAVHGERVQVNAVGLGNGESGAVVLGQVGGRVVGEGATIVADDESTIVQEGHSVLVRVEVGPFTSRIPVTCAGPSHPCIGGSPEVDTAGVQFVGIGGVHGEAEVIPGLASGVGTVDRPAEQVRGGAVQRLGIPGVSAVDAAPDSGESLIADFSGHGVDHGGVRGAKGQGDATQSVGVAIEILGAPAASGVVALGDEVAERAGQKVVRVGRVDFEAGDVPGEGPRPAHPAIEAAVHAETRRGPQGVGPVGVDQHARLGPAHVRRPIQRRGAPALAAIFGGPDPDGPGVSEIAISRGDPQSVRIGGVEG